ncbi:MAG: hypothetical protein ACP5E2_02445 [Terracidiphilus sp.]
MQIVAMVLEDLFNRRLLDCCFRLHPLLVMLQPHKGCELNNRRRKFAELFNSQYAILRQEVCLQYEEAGNRFDGGGKRSPELKFCGKVGRNSADVRRCVVMDQQWARKTRTGT